MKRAAAAAALLGAAATGHAATQPQPVLEPSQALACLTPAREQRGEPEYPFDLYKRGIGGRVKAQVQFPGGLFGPAIEIVERQGEAAFVDAVKSHLRKLSVPCLAAGGSATLVFEFVFRPGSLDVKSPPPVDADYAARRRMLACVMPIGTPLERPDYPPEAARQRLQGRVLARLRFDAGNRAPAVELFNRSSAKLLADAVRDWTSRLRMPCHEGGPVTVVQNYVFVGEGEGYGFKPMDLPSLLRISKGLRERGLQVDTNQLGCPFSLQMTYLRPYLYNKVEERGEPDPRREPLLRWLADTDLDLAAPALDAVYADTADITVPCLKIDIVPKEKSS